MTTAEEPLGGAADEAGRLLASLKDWLDARGLADLPIATGGENCRVCPVCRVIGTLRDGNPELVEQLSRAGDALVKAVASVISEHEHRWVSGRTPDVERIDIDE
jgi:hypothetical protein